MVAGDMGGGAAVEEPFIGRGGGVVTTVAVGGVQNGEVVP